MHYIISVLNDNAEQLFSYKSNVIPAADDLIKFNNSGYKVLRRVHTLDMIYDTEITQVAVSIRVVKIL